MDATARTLPELQAEGCIVEFSSLAEDKLTWDIWLDQLEDADGLVPDIGQIISLWRDSTRFFRGHVTGRTPRYSSGRMGYSITVSGPWYFLANTSISSTVPDETTAESERATYVFDTGSPRDHLISLVSRAIDLGMPVSMGSIATVFDVPRLSLSEMSFGEAISEVMRWVADGLVYFDYSASSGHPALCMQRRDPATTITLNPVVLAVSDLTVEPRYDLLIEELKIFYAKRVTSGSKRVTAYDSQSAGTATSPLPTRQIITSTGPEIDTFLPQDLTDSVILTSSAISSGTIARALEIHHDLLRTSGARVQVYSEAVGDTVGGVTTYWPDAPVLSVTDNEGNDVDLGEWPFFLAKGEIKEWFKKDGIEALQARVTATVASSIICTLTEPAPEKPKWAKVLGAKASSHFVMQSSTLHVRYVWQASVSCTVPLVKGIYSGTLVIRQEDWGWFNPPAGLAANLLATQNWLPFEGAIPCAVDEIPAGNAVGSVLNISNWVAETASMRAMISGYSVRPATGQITYTLGPPARHAYRDLVNRFRQSGADNIYWLDAATPAAPDTPPSAPTGHIADEDGTPELNEDNTTFPTDEDA